jgi:hypothetical protein
MIELFFNNTSKSWTQRNLKSQRFLTQNMVFRDNKERMLSEEIRRFIT